MVYSHTIAQMPAYNNSDNTINEEDSEKSAQQDLIWIGRLKKGHIRAFDFLVKKYQRRIYNLVYNITSNKNDTEDLSQDIFVKAFKYIHSFKGNSSFYTWLYRIAINTTYTFLKKHRKNPTMSLESWDNNETNEAIFAHIQPFSSGEKSTLLKELQEKLNESLQKLSLSHRTVVVLFEIDGMSHAEIAKIMNCSEGTVRSRLHYAKEQLKKLLSEYIKNDE